MINNIVGKTLCEVFALRNELNMQSVISDHAPLPKDQLDYEKYYDFVIPFADSN